MEPLYRGDPLEWWYRNRDNYPILYQMALNYLCMQGTSVPAERLFSTAGLIISDRRTRLTGERAEMLILLNNNLRVHPHLQIKNAEIVEPMEVLSDDED